MWLMLMLVPASASFAGEKTAGTITGFGPLEENEYFFQGQAEEETLVSGLPGQLGVYLDGGSRLHRIDVRWEIVEDLEEADCYSCCARPVWGIQYRLAEGMDAQMDVPWITLIRMPEDLEETAAKKSASESSAKAEKKGKVIGFSDLRNHGARSAAEDKVYTYLTETLGLNMAAACGIMTNLYAESGMQPNNLENTYNVLYGLSDAEYTKRVNKGRKNKGKYTSGFGKTRYFTRDYCGYGICQWTSLGRRTGLLKAAVKKDVSIANLKMQLAFMKGELKKSYPQVWATVTHVPNDAQGAYLAAAHFCASYEIPRNPNGTAVARGKSALNTYWKQYSGRKDKASGTSFLALCGYSYPQLIRKGNGMTVSGQVISNYKLKSVSLKIQDSKGRAVYKSTKKTAARIYSLYAFDSAMKFRKLPGGTYTYVITAKDKKGKTVTARHPFRVKKNAKAQILRGFAAENLRTKLPEN